MILDVLNDLDVKEEDLSLSALSFVRAAQERKDKLKLQLQEDKEKAYYNLLKKGMVRSSMLYQIYNRLQSAYDAQVALLLDNLAFDLNFLGDNAEGGGEGGSQEYSYPYNPNYSLDSAGRYYAVYNYYMAMTDAKIRYALFQADTLAPDYLGEFYATLSERLRSYAETA